MGPVRVGMRGMRGWAPQMYASAGRAAGGGEGEGGRPVIMDLAAGAVRM